jgi:hypothetical protein
MKKFFNLENAALKEQYRNEINELVHEHIEFNFDLRKSQVKRWIAELEASNSKTDKQVNKLAEYKKQLEDLKVSYEKLKELETRNDKPFFLWKLFFADVFTADGFDIMIGNPPYRQLQQMKDEADILQEADFETFSKSGDIYCLFYEQGNKLLKQNGLLCYITSNSWMKTKYGKLLRQYFSAQTNPIKLLNFEDTKIFQTAVVETNILLAQKSAQRNIFKVAAIKSDYRLGTSLDIYFKANFFEVNELDDNGWIISGKESMVLKIQMESVGVPLKDWDVEIYIGILNGFNDAYLIGTELRNELIKKSKRNEELIKPILRGRDLKKYSYKWDKVWLINSHNGIKKLGIERIQVEKDYPAIYAHFLPYKHELEVRQNKGDHWTNLRNCAYFLEFEKPKIIWGELSDVPKFAYDEKGMYAEATLFAMTGENLKLLLAILNSRIALWYFNQITTTSGMGTSRWKKYKIEQLPIPKIQNKKIIEKFEVFADYLIYLNDENNPPVNPYTSNASIEPVLEDVLNMMVYELYFKEHMQEQEIDVLKFVNAELFPPLTKDDKSNVELIGKVYKRLQEQENPIRNRIILSNIRSKDIIRRINSTTH